VWNPTTGCTRVSAGCDNCYAFALHDKRYASNLKAADASAKDRGEISDHREAALAVTKGPMQR
jgi:protein gp37